jgi:hypothetical protein
MFKVNIKGVPSPYITLIHQYQTTFEQSTLFFSLQQGYFYSLTKTLHYEN